MFRGAQDYERVRKAMEAHQNWVHITLTFEDHKTVSAYKRYKEGFLHWSVLRKRIIREFGPIRYIQTWERHKSGIPHCHLAVSNFYMYHEATGSSLTNWWRMLRQDAMATGFGRRGWLEPLRPGHHFGAYLTKLANELIGAGTKDQVPENAPPHFRRIRATQGLLSPPDKDPDLTGRLFFCPAGSIESLHAADAPEQDL